MAASAAAACGTHCCSSISAWQGQAWAGRQALQDTQVAPAGTSRARPATHGPAGPHAHAPPAYTPCSTGPTHCPLPRPLPAPTSLPRAAPPRPTCRCHCARWPWLWATWRRCTLCCLACPPSRRTRTPRPRCSVRGHALPRGPARAACSGGCRTPLHARAAPPLHPAQLSLIKVLSSSDINPLNTCVSPTGDPLEDEESEGGHSRGASSSEGSLMGSFNKGE